MYDDPANCWNLHDEEFSHAGLASVSYQRTTIQVLFIVSDTKHEGFDENAQLRKHRYSACRDECAVVIPVHPQHCAFQRMICSEDWKPTYRIHECTKADRADMADPLPVELPGPVNAQSILILGEHRY